MSSKQLKQTRNRSKKQKHLKRQTSPIESERKEVEKETRNCNYYLPNELQLHIISFLDSNTRLKLLKHKYPPNFFKTRLTTRPVTDLSLRKMYQCIQSTKTILFRYLEKESEVWVRVGVFVSTSFDNILQYMNPVDKAWRKVMQKRYLDDIVYTLLAILKNYSKMYKETSDKDEHTKVENIMLRFYYKILTL